MDSDAPSRLVATTEEFQRLVVSAKDAPASPAW
jgi:hypothetical protein